MIKQHTFKATIGAFHKPHVYLKRLTFTAPSYGCAENTVLYAAEQRGWQVLQAPEYVSRWREFCRKYLKIGA